MVIKENQPSMWDIREYELVVPGRPTRARFSLVTMNESGSHHQATMSCDHATSSRHQRKTAPAYRRQNDVGGKSYFNSIQNLFFQSFLTIFYLRVSSKLERHRMLNKSV